MKIKRKGSARWEGTGKEGKGTVSTFSGVLNNNQFSHSSRFADGIGTNPEELIAAAHAGCFSMKLAFVLNAAGITADSIDTNATTVLEDGAIREVHLKTTVKAPGLDQDKLQEFASDAKENCPVSKSLTASVFLEASLA